MLPSTLQSQQIPGDLIFFGGRNLNQNMKRNQPDDGGGDREKKKKMHRDIERQRRQEMANLCVSLRDLLPIEYIRGTRAASEHVNGAVSYIKKLQNKIEELGAKKKDLEKEIGSSSYEGTSSSSMEQSSLPDVALVSECLGGFEVAVTNGIGIHALKVSRVLQLLVEEGLNVVNCVSTRVDGGNIHTIQCEVINYLVFVDASMLQQKLNEVISG